MGYGRGSHKTLPQGTCIERYNGDGNGHGNGITDMELDTRRKGDMDTALW